VPDCAGGNNPDSSTGAGDPAKTQYLVDCSNGPDKDTGPMDCDWWVTPARPGSAEAARQQRRAARAGREFNASPEAARLRQRMADIAAGR
jgi:hypothetical protein